MKKLIATLLALSCIYSMPGRAEGVGQDFRINLTGKKASFDTITGETQINGVEKKGLVAASKRNGKTMLRFWQPGAFRETITLNDKVLIDGLDISDMARISGFRLGRDGSYVYLRTTKGPKARVRLIQNGRDIRSWPRGHHLRIISYDTGGLILSETLSADKATAFFQFVFDDKGVLKPEAKALGQVEACVVQSARKQGPELLLQLYCSHDQGNDVARFDTTTGRLSPLLTSQEDEIFGSALSRRKGVVPILQITGNDNGRRAFHAVSNVMLSSFGEPLSLASDWAGSQSWGQSFRLRALAALSEKTQHPVFAALARVSIKRTLSQTNKSDTPFNPSCAWASRIYSLDGKEPISLLVNQGMIASSMIDACTRMEEHCPASLRKQIIENARCLMSAYETTFDASSNLYRIQYGSAFRFDGIWAPWNWQLAWAPVIKEVGKTDKNKALLARSADIVNQFLDTWEIGEKGALWRYWTPHFYTGWDKKDEVSKNRPNQKAHASKRYEDTAHAGIALLGLQQMDIGLPAAHRKALETRLNTILSSGTFTPRDLDGAGPASARWLPGSGFDAAATDDMRAIFSRNLPGARAGDQLLAMVKLIEADEPIDANVALMLCDETGCTKHQEWTFSSLMEIVEKNPLFSIVPH